MELKLKELRKKAGFKSVKDFSDFCGLPKQTLYNYEQGISGMSLENACIIADALNCSLDELAGRDLSKIHSSLSFNEQKLISDFRQLDDDSRESITQLAGVLPKSENQGDSRLAVGE